MKIATNIKMSSVCYPASCIDKRGHKLPKNKIDVIKVKEHIESCPSYKSILSDTPNRRCLKFDLTISKRYKLYVEKCQ